LLKRWFQSLRKHVPVLALVTFGLIISSLCFVILRSIEAEKAQSAFQHASQQRIDELQSNLTQSVNQVVALGAFCESSYPVTYSSFNNFVPPLLSGSNPGIQALEWAPRVPADDRQQFESSARAAGFTGFEIRERLNGKLVPAGVRPVYFPVFYLHPGASNQAALGYDLLSDKSRRETIMHSAYTGEISATQRITLVQGAGDQYGILILRPIFRHQDSSLGRRELLGFALGVLQIGNIVEKHSTPYGVELSIADLSAPPCSAAALSLHWRARAACARVPPQPNHRHRRPLLARHSLTHARRLSRQPNLQLRRLCLLPAVHPARRRIRG
jgi:CHASE1-domain containing sensor protein